MFSFYKHKIYIEFHYSIIVMSFPNRDNEYQIKLVKLKKEDSEQLLTSINQSCSLKEAQLYNPIMSQYMTYFNNEYSSKSFTFHNKYTLLSLEKEDNKYKGIISKNYKQNSQNNTWKDNVFVKINPLLEVYSFMKHDYCLNSSMPNIFNYLTMSKLNSTNNSGYVETFCNYILSRLTETGKCPTFPYYYGCATGVSQTFRYNISDEYGGIRKSKWFPMYNNKLYYIETEEIDESDLDNPNFEFDSSLEADNFTALTTGKFQKSSLTTIRYSDTEHSDEEHKSTSTQHNDNTNDNNDNNDDDNDDDNDDINDTYINDISNDENDGDKEDNDETDSQNNLTDIEELSELDDNDFEYQSTVPGDLEIIPDLDSEDFELDKEYFVNIHDFPVQVICMEWLDITLDEYIERYSIPEKEWLGIIFQICFGLSVGQKHFALTHNDLHGNNIMFKKTNQKYLYFCYENTYFQIPTFNKITKIIDFTRAVFQINNRLYFSDVFRKEGDAEGQYSYPYKNNLEKCLNKPNPSFDLARLATTIAHHFPDSSPIYQLLLSWMTDKQGNNLGEEKDSFELYIKIARGVENAKPKEQMLHHLFNDFHIDKELIPDNSFIYYY